MSLSVAPEDLMPPRTRKGGKHAPKRPRNMSELGALRRYAIATGNAEALEKYKAQIAGAMIAAEGSIPTAAAALHLSLRQLYRILDEPWFVAMRLPRREAGRPPKE